jgi:hypothetical protein
MCWRDHAIDRVIAGDADERIVCSLTIRKVFVLTLSFQATDDDFFSSLEMSRSQCESAPYPQTPWGYMVKRVSAYGGCLGGRRR